jgi:membrane-bound ClpP family serine protease
VTVQGEIWRAVADGGPVDEGVPVRVVDVQGLTLRVVKADNPGGAL